MTNSVAGGVVRIWRGRTKAQEADFYTNYLYEGGPKELERLGARGVQMFRRELGDETEFVVMSYWDSLDAMKAWAGEQPTRIRHLERDPELLVELPDSVEIFEVLANSWRLADGVR